MPKFTLREAIGNIDETIELLVKVSSKRHRKLKRRVKALEAKVQYLVDTVEQKLNIVSCDACPARYSGDIIKVEDELTIDVPGYKYGISLNADSESEPLRVFPHVEQELHDSELRQLKESLRHASRTRPADCAGCPFLEIALDKDQP